MNNLPAMINRDIDTLKSPMHTSFIRLTLCIITGTALFLPGCSKKPISPYTPGSNEPTSSVSSSPRYPSSQPIIQEDFGPIEELLTASEQSSGLSNDVSTNYTKETLAYKEKYGRSSYQMQPIYFHFDQSTISDEQIPFLEQNARYLRNHPQAKLLIIGNTDIRGTHLYNLALGERRAQSAKTYLLELGIEAYRIRTTSYGEEDLLFPGIMESDHARNRRDDFIIE